MNIIKDIEELITEEMHIAHSYYTDHIKGPRLSFRLLGLATLALSVAIPFISQESLALPNKALWITGLSLSITVVTGISTFFKPDEIWKLNMGAKLNLETLFAVWKLECLEAKSLPEQSDVIKKYIEASKKFLQSAQNITSANTEGFFANVNLSPSK